MLAVERTRAMKRTKLFEEAAMSGTGVWILCCERLKDLKLMS